MKLSLTHIKKAVFVEVLLLAALLVIAGCSEIQPYSPPNHREEGPAKGLFTGSQGAWVITLPEATQAGGEENKNTASDAETDRKEKKNPEEAADGMQE
jgi:hypothetical protein